MTLTGANKGLESRVTGVLPAHGAFARTSPPQASPEIPGLRESAATIAEASPPVRGPVRLASVDASQAWPHLADALERVRERGARWPVEFVKGEIDGSRAAVFRFIRDGKHLAYMVVERVDSFDVSLNVWAFAGDFEGDHSPQLIDEVTALIDQLARNVGACRWKAEGREGWGRVLRDRASRSFTVYERDVQ